MTTKSASVIALSTPLDREAHHADDNLRTVPDHPHRGPVASGGVAPQDQVHLQAKARPILLQMLASELEVEVTVKDRDLGVDVLREKAEDVIDHLHDLLGTEDHCDALNAASALIGALDRVSYRELASHS